MKGHSCSRCESWCESKGNGISRGMSIIAIVIATGPARLLDFRVNSNRDLTQTRAYLTRPPRPFPLSLRPPPPLTSLRPKGDQQPPFSTRHGCRHPRSRLKPSAVVFLHDVCHLVHACYFTNIFLINRRGFNENVFRLERYS